MVDLVVKNAKVVTESRVFRGGVAVENGIIVALSSNDHLPSGKKTIDAMGHYLLPGGVDAHVHLRAPAISYREDFKSGTLAAAHGGTTTIIEMPLTSPPTYCVDQLMARVEAAEEQALVDVGFYGACGNKLENIVPLANSGVLAFKTFVQSPPQGRENEYIGVVMEDEYRLYKGFNEVRKTGLPLAVHTETVRLVNGIIEELKMAGKTSAEYHAVSRPILAEIEMVERLICYAAQTKVPLYLTHLTSADSVRLAVEARHKGIRIITESCPHYLYFTEKDIVEYGPYAVCNPPFRKQNDVDSLWEMVRSGGIDIISSDHAPFTTDDKEKGRDNIFLTPPGLPGIEYRIPLMLTAVKAGGLDIVTAAKLLSTNAAKALGLYPRKGAIQVGSDADMIIIDMDSVYCADHHNLYTKSKDSAILYDGIELCGKVMKTLVRGQVVMDEDGPQVDFGYGKWQKSNKSLGL